MWRGRTGRLPERGGSRLGLEGHDDTPGSVTQKRGQGRVESAAVSTSKESGGHTGQSHKTGPAGSGVRTRQRQGVPWGCCGGGSSRRRRTSRSFTRHKLQVSPCLCPAGNPVIPPGHICGSEDGSKASDLGFSCLGQVPQLLWLHQEKERISVVTAMRKTALGHHQTSD